jgi:hypothetical protein
MAALVGAFGQLSTFPFSKDFINRHLPGSTHNVERLPTKIAIKYNLLLPIAKEVANHIITDPKSVIDHQPIMDTVFVYYKKEE